MDKEQKWFKTMVLETRPLLKSINFFIILNHELQNVCVVLQNNMVQVKLNDNIHEINLEDIEIVQDSLTNLQYSKDYLVFRVTTNCKSQRGTFRTELIDANYEKLETFSCNNLKVQPYSISCIKCNQVFIGMTEFERILPLPSEHSEPSEWFCHKHADDKTDNLSPKLNDIFYSNCFMHLHSQLLQGIETHGSVFNCKNCSSWLGLTLSDGNYKLWFNSVVLKSNSDVLKSDALQDVFVTLRELQSNDFITSNKYLLSCQISEKETHFLKLWIIEKSLTIFLYKSSLKKEHKASKTLFKVYLEKTKEVQEWQRDVQVINQSISKNMMDNVIQHLYEMKKLIPCTFSESNNFSVSYLLMYDKTFV